MRSLRLAASGIALLVLGGLASAAPQAPRPSSDDELEQSSEESASPETLRRRARFGVAQRHFKAGRYQQAATGFRACLEADPRSLDAAKMLGLSQLELGNHEAAARTLLHAFNLDPSNAGLPLLLARVHRDLGHLDLGDALLNQVEKAHGWSAAIAGERVEIARAREDSKAVIAALSAWVAKAPEDLRPLRSLLEERRSREEFGEAVAVARRLAELQTDEPGAVLQLAYVLRDADRCAEAAAVLEKLVAARPDQMVARDNLVRLYERRVSNPRRLEIHKAALARAKAKDGPR